MSKKLKRYNKDALLCNFRNIVVTCSIVRNQIDCDGFKIFYNQSWSTWYLIEKKYTSDSCPSQGAFNVYENIGQHNSELELLYCYLNKNM